MIVEKISLIADILVILFICIGVGTYLYEEYKAKDLEEKFEVEPQGCRAIGRTDKNGRSVYEGDIIRFEYVFEEPEERLTDVMEIVWDNEVCGFICQDVKNVNIRSEILSQEYFEKNIEVIGNRWLYNDEWRKTQ
ncbi:MAG: hypothetical protein IJV83_00065 [Clostridia bacterium]|nr:hypothetical protein [Clostridia bacterium]